VCITATLGADWQLRVSHDRVEHQQVQPCPLFADRYRNGEPLNPTRRAKSDDIPA
jgi:hypothetical protein